MNLHMRDMFGEVEPDIIDKHHIMKQLKAYAAAYATAEPSLEIINDLGGYENIVRLPNIYHGIFDTFINLLEEKLVAISKEAADGTGAMIQKSQLSDGLISYHDAFEQCGANGKLRKPNTVHGCVEWYENTYDWGLLRSEISGLRVCLREKGVRDVAKKLYDKFHCFGDGWFAIENPVKLVKGRVQLKTSFHNRSQNAQKLESWHNQLCWLAQETGCDHPGLALRDLASALRDLSYDTGLQSRTRFGKGCSLEVTVFKDKLALSLTPEFYISLYSFIQAHNSELIRGDYEKIYSELLI